MGADVVFSGGRVFTGDGWSDGLAVQGERIVGVGAAAAADLRGPGTRVIDLAGRMALPGFHDAHTHLIGGAMASERLDLSGVSSNAELGLLVATWIQRRGWDQWVTGRGWDADLFPGGRLPTRAHLDAVAPGTPVVLRRRDGHASLANSRALELAGIGPDTPDPPGGRIQRGADGAPTGILLEDPAIELVERLVPPLERDVTERAVALTLRHAASLGITSLQDDPSYDETLRPAALYRALYERGELPVRISIWRKLGRTHESLRAEEVALAASGVPAAHVHYSLLKGYLDGSLGSRTAQLFAPYADAPETCGVDLDEAEALVAHAIAADAAGYQVGLHAIGDRAAARALDTFAACARRATLRHRVEHAQLFRPADIGRLAQLGAVASVQPIHLASDILVAEARLGRDRCQSAYPWSSLQRAGALLAFGTDFPVEPLDPLPGLVCAVARRSPRRPDLAPFVPSEALTLEGALRAYTLGGAEAGHLQGQQGRLAPGLLADVAVLSADLSALPPEAWPEVRCELTLRGGEVVFEG